MDAASRERQAVRQDITNSLERATRQSYRTVDIATDTNKELQRQDEKICEIDHTLDETDYQLKRAERHVRATASWRGVVANWFTRTPGGPGRPAATTAEVNGRAADTRRKSEPPTEPNEDPTTAADGEPARRPSATAPFRPAPMADEAQSIDAGRSTVPTAARGSNPPTASPGSSNGLVSGTHTATSGAWDPKDAQLLDELHNNVFRLRDHALLQNDMLARQNEALDHVAGKATAVQDRLDKNHQNVRKLL